MDDPSLCYIGPRTQPDDPAYALLLDGYTSTPVFKRPTCYICMDPEFAQMGLPLCYPCPHCNGHVPADDTECTDCGKDARPDPSDEPAGEAL